MLSTAVAYSGKVDHCYCVQILSDSGDYHLITRAAAGGNRLTLKSDVALRASSMEIGPSETSTQTCYSVSPSTFLSTDRLPGK
jgi:argininosuccinate synthase